MGWNAWNYFQFNIDDTIVRGIADAMATNGMMAAGYQYINLTIAGSRYRDSNGVIVPDPIAFLMASRRLLIMCIPKGLNSALFRPWIANLSGSVRAATATNILMPTPMRPGAWIISNTIIALCRRGMFLKRLCPHGSRANANRTPNHLQHLLLVVRLVGARHWQPLAHDGGH